MKPIADRWRRFVRAAYVDVLVERVPPQFAELLAKLK